MEMQGIRLVLAALAAGVLFAGNAMAQDAPKGDAARGKTLMVQHGCWQCHGFEGQGSNSTSNGKVLAHTKLPEEAFVAFVRGTNRAMPPFSAKLVSDADLADIYAYLQSVPKPKDPNSIKLLNQ